MKNYSLSFHSISIDTQSPTFPWHFPKITPSFEMAIALTVVVPTSMLNTTLDSVSGEPFDILPIAGIWQPAKWFVRNIQLIFHPLFFDNRASLPTPQNRLFEMSLNLKCTWNCNLIIECSKKQQRKDWCDVELFYRLDMLKIRQHKVF